MNTRREIEKVLRSKSITAESICYEGAGPDEYGWWTITLSEKSKRDCQRLLNEPEFGRHIEFCELDEGFQQLSELPDCAGERP